MKTILRKILLIIMLIVLSLGTVYASIENNTSTIEQISTNDDLSMIEDAFDFKQVAKQELQPDNSIQLAVIQNAYHYVVIIAVLYVFSLIIITILIINTPKHQARDIVTTIGLVTVIFGAILLAMVVDTDQALTAPMGILGAIAGYLFGSAQRKEDSKDKTKE
ncbi:MAG: hypothetical protein DRG09_02130 [Epsilonproteobacteria bacterium]|nr:MAG: hypothetical protein DRG09_02130 [Campylobacterota bacterium]